MKKLALALLVSCLAVAAHAKEEKFKLIHATDLQTMLKSEQKPTVCDANNKETREQYGVIPGAILLKNYKKWDVAKTLPADKTAPVVFYCANEMCMASHGAAQKAVKAGYTNVAVMSDGIMGWAKQGNPVNQLPKASKSTKS